MARCRSSAFRTCTTSRSASAPRRLRATWLFATRKPSSICAQRAGWRSCRSFRSAAGPTAPRRPHSTISRLDTAPPQAQVAIAWLLARSPAMLPIPGTSSVAHLEENWAARTLALTPDEVAAISNARNSADHWTAAWPNRASQCHRATEHAVESDPFVCSQRIAGMPRRDLGGSARAGIATAGTARGSPLRRAPRRGRAAARVARGDRAAFGELYDRLAPTMLSLAYRMLGAQREAEDLVHDVFIECWQNAAVRQTRGSVRAWFLVRTRSRALDRLRSARRAAAVPLDEALLGQLAAHRPILAGQEGGMLQRLLLQLSSEQRVVVELGYFAGYSCAEIADASRHPGGHGQIAHVARARAAARAAAGIRRCTPVIQRRRAGQAPSLVAAGDGAAEALMAAYAAGDRRAWEPLFDRLAPRLLGFFQRSLQDPAAAEEHVEATFVQLHRARHSYRPGCPRGTGSSGSQPAYGSTAAASSERRARRGAVRAPAGTGASGRERPRPAGTAGARRLANHERIAIHLHRVERMTFEEIAEVLGWTEEAVRCQVLHAYRALRERLWALSDDGAGP